MSEKTRFAVVAIMSATAGAIITAVIDRFALRQDLEFLGIIHADVKRGVDDLKKKIEGETNDD
ncbi:membrane protein [Arthrobacter phage Qui]|uniref:Membrane protein n=1 Tax=Arthrobacter phage Qui TaxID=2603260 RepID=A0A5B8WPG3_9CAUD|nr:membrane protein [Arthrobacter phage Qui]QED11568.1 membrane protein [Arthrobacter phage Qui]QOC56400.1 membrane protein [Arthrobacter phage Paella]